MSGQGERRPAGSDPAMGRQAASNLSAGLRRLFKRPRMLGEVSFALGAALIMALAGTLVALAGPPLRPLPTASPAVRWFMHGASGFGIGWWVGLVWSVGLALHARRYQPPPPLTALTRATWIAAGVLVATTFAGLYLKVSFLGSAGAGVVAGTLAARVLVSRAAHRGQP